MKRKHKNISLGRLGCPTGPSKYSRRDGLRLHRRAIPRVRFAIVSRIVCWWSARLVKSPRSKLSSNIVMKLTSNSGSYMSLYSDSCFQSLRLLRSSLYSGTNRMSCFPRNITTKQSSRMLSRVASHFIYGTRDTIHLGRSEVL